VHQLVNINIKHFSICL